MDAQIPRRRKAALRRRRSAIGRKTLLRPDSQVLCAHWRDLDAQHRDRHRSHESDGAVAWACRGRADGPIRVDPRPRVEHRELGHQQRRGAPDRRIGRIGRQSADREHSQDTETDFYFAGVAWGRRSLRTQGFHLRIDFWQRRLRVGCSGAWPCRVVPRSSHGSGRTRAGHAKDRRPCNDRIGRRFAGNSDQRSLRFWYLGEGGIVPALVTAAGATLAASWWYSRKLHVDRVALTPTMVRGEVASLLKLRVGLYGQRVSS